MKRTRSRFRRGHAAAAALLVLGASADARADILPSGAKAVEYSYEIDNLPRHTGFTLVVWPRSCGSDGEPIGAIHFVDESRLLEHTIDYEVLEPGPRELLKYCGAASRVYALDATAFPADSRIATEDDWHLGRKKDRPYLGVRAIDAMTLRDRVPFFARERAASFKFPYVLLLRTGTPIRTIHDVFTVQNLDKDHFEIGPVKVRYGLERGGPVDVPWTSGGRPPPTGLGPQALRRPSGFGEGDDDDAAGEKPDTAPTASIARARGDAGRDGSPTLVEITPGRTWTVWAGLLGVAVLGAVVLLAMRRKRPD